MATLVYDGACGFCTSAARVLRERIGTRDAVVASDDADLAALGITRAQADEAVQRIAEDGTVMRGARAIAGSLRAAPQPWRSAGAIIDARPVRPVAAWAYALVARNRHRLPGSTCGD